MPAPHIVPDECRAETVNRDIKNTRPQSAIRCFSAVKFSPKLIGLPGQFDRDRPAAQRTVAHDVLNVGFPAVQPLSVFLLLIMELLSINFCQL